jgi:metal-dependent amidase/aminoacylase/carboxypeptidase family protein
VCLFSFLVSDTLGCVAEEGGLGKQKLLDGGAYEGMDVCIMCHPNAGPESSSAYGVALSVQEIQVEYSGHRYGPEPMLNFCK